MDIIFSIHLQLLKSLFGANLIAQWEDDKGIPSQMKSKISSSDHKQYYGYYENVLQHSYDQLTEYIEENNKQLKDHSKGYSFYFKILFHSSI